MNTGGAILLGLVFVGVQVIFAAKIVAKAIEDLSKTIHHLNTHGLHLRVYPGALRDARRDWNAP